MIHTIFRLQVQMILLLLWLALASSWVAVLKTLFFKVIEEEFSLLVVHGADVVFHPCCVIISAPLAWFLVRTIPGQVSWLVASQAQPFCVMLLSFFGRHGPEINLLSFFFNRVLCSALASAKPSACAVPSILMALDQFLHL